MLKDTVGDLARVESVGFGGCAPYPGYGAGVISHNSGMQMNTASPEQKAADPMYPVTDPLMQPLNLSKEEIKDLAAFLESITATQYKMRRPEALPRQ